MSREVYRGLTVLLAIVCVVLLVGLAATFLNYSSALREKDEAIASLNSRLNSFEEWLRGNITYYEGELSSLRGELKAKVEEAEGLKAEVEALKAQVSDLEGRLTAFRGGKLIPVNLKCEDVRPLIGNTYLRVYGAVCNVGFETAYNCRLHVAARQADGVVAVDTYIVLGDLDAGSWRGVDSKIYYTGGPLVGWVVTAEWSNETSAVRLEKLEISTAYATYSTVKKVWTVTLRVKNTGVVDAVVVDLLVNGRTFSAYRGQIAVSPSLDNGLPVLVGETVDVRITVGADGFTSGQSITITLHTLSGQDYSKTVVLP